MSLTRTTAATPRLQAVRTAPRGSSPVCGAVQETTIPPKYLWIVNNTWEAREAHQDRMEGKRNE